MTCPILPITALTLVGGLGTRLRSLVSDKPKPMIAVNGAPFLQILLEDLERRGIRNFVLLTGYRGEMIEDYFRDGFSERSNIVCVREDEPLGTGGAVRNAAPLATDPSLIVNGDTFFDADIEKLYEYHTAKGAEVTLSLIQVEDVSRYGSVDLDEDGRITGFREKDGRAWGPGLINAGLSIMTKDFIEALPARGAFSMEKEIFPTAAEEGVMYGLVQQGAFFDIGTPESYAQFAEYIRQTRYGK